jgi:outer membrane protein assembly factor BamB
MLRRSLSVIFLAALLCPLHLSAAPAQPDDWALPNLDRSNTRAVAQSPITAANVSQLRVRWRFPFDHSSVSNYTPSPETIRGVVATPIVVGNTVYVQDSTSAVYAVDRSTGALRWVDRYGADNFGRNGLSYSSGSLYAATDTTVFALSAATGQMLWERRLVSPVEQFVDVAPLIAHNLVYVSTVGYPPDGRGAIYALDAHNGAVRWKFVTIRSPWSHPAVAGGGGSWYPPAIDAAGDIYVGVANPYPSGGTDAFSNGAAFAGSALYTDSLLVLNGQTGRLLWYDQVTPRDIRDYDFQLSPILTTIERRGSAVGIVIGAGKAGLVIAWNRATRTRIWQTSVGRHLRDKGLLPSRTVEICPGFYGGVETPMAEANGRVYVPVVNLCARGSATGYEAVGQLNPVDGTGAFVALDARTGAVLWSRTLAQPDFGCATVAAGVVFTSSFDGELYAFDAATGKTLWQARAPAGIDGCPALSGDMLIVAAGSGSTKMPDPRYALVAYALP